MSSTVNVTGNVTLLIGNQGSQGGTMLIVNLDASNTIWVNENTQVQYGGPQGIPVPPGGSISMTSTQGLWAVSSGPVVQTALIPNGTAYFLPASLINIGGAKVYVQSATPAGIIPPNSIWFDTSNDSLQTWNGTRWVTQQFSGQELILPATLLGSQLANGTLTSAQLAAAAGILGTQIASATITGGNIAANTIVASNIAANTITAAELAAGIVYAGIINGTTVEGATFIATNSGGEFLGYTSSPPSTSNLYISISPTDGTDTPGNTITNGVTVYGDDGVQMSLGQGVGTGEVGTPGNLYQVFKTASNYNVWYPNIHSVLNNAGTATETTSLYMDSGSYQSEPNAAAIQLTSENEGGTTNPGAYIGISAIGSGGTITLVPYFSVTDSLVITAPMVAIVPGTNASEYYTWGAVTLQNGWTNSASTTTLSVKLMPDNSVWIAGQVKNPTAIGSTNSTICTLNSGLFDTTKNKYDNATIGSTSATTALLAVTTAGAFEVYGPIAANATVSINMRFPLAGV